MPVNDIYVVDVNTEYQNNPNVMCFNALLTQEADASQVANDLGAWGVATLVPALLPIHNPGVMFRCLSIRQIYPTTALPVIVSLNDAPGTNNGVKEPLPGQLSLVITLFGNIVSPTGRNRGRDFWYGANTDNMDEFGEKWTLAHVNVVLTFYQTLTNIIEGDSNNNFDLGVFSRTQAFENDNPDFVGEDGIMNSDRDTFGDPHFNQLIRVRTDSLIRTQRRRQPEDPCAAFDERAIASTPP